jgi:hypothetical protein
MPANAPVDRAPATTGESADFFEMQRDDSMIPTTLRLRDNVHRSVSMTPIVLTAALIGCGVGGFDPTAEKVYPVKGQVLLASGKPLTSGKVTLLPKSGLGLSSSGEIGSDGSFTLKASDGREGAPAGEYKVRIEPAGSIASKKTGRVDPRLIPFPTKYMDEDGDTGLTATVKTESTQLQPFKLVDAPVDGGSNGRRRD